MMRQRLADSRVAEGFSLRGGVWEGGDVYYDSALFLTILGNALNLCLSI